MTRPALRHIAAALLATAASASAAPGTEPRRWTPEALTSPDYESSPAFTPDSRELYFMGADRSFGRYRLLVSRCEGGRWTAPMPPPFALPPPVNEADPFVTPDRGRLYFVSSRRAPGRAADADDLDIWRVDRGTDGRWSMHAGR